MGYRTMGTAPENEELDVMWNRSPRPEYGRALRLGNEWFIKSDPNPHGNGRHCTTPNGWLPRWGSERAKAEKRLCDILATIPHLVG